MGSLVCWASCGSWRVTRRLRGAETSSAASVSAGRMRVGAGFLCPFTVICGGDITAFGSLCGVWRAPGSWALSTTAGVLTTVLTFKVRGVCIGGWCETNRGGVEDRDSLLTSIESMIFCIASTGMSSVSVLKDGSFRISDANGVSGSSSSSSWVSGTPNSPVRRMV